MWKVRNSGQQHWTGALLQQGRWLVATDTDNIFERVIHLNGCSVKTLICPQQHMLELASCSIVSVPPDHLTQTSGCSVFTFYLCINIIYDYDREDYMNIQQWCLLDIRYFSNNSNISVFTLHCHGDNCDKYQETLGSFVQLNKLFIDFLKR